MKEKENATQEQASRSHPEKKNKSEKDNVEIEISDMKGIDLIQQQKN